MWFTTKVRYEKTRENGSLKTITEPYLVDALSFTEAEARITNEMMPYTSGAFSVSAVKRSNISEIFWDENGDHFYKAKINLITLDENTGAERKKAIYILVQASDLNQAAKNLAEGMRGTVSDYEVASIGKTPIERTARNMLPLYLTMVIVLMLVTYIPDISLLLPRLLMGYGA